MRFDRLIRKLDGIGDASKKGRPVKDLYKLMSNVPEIWYEAYANIYSNKGALTKGMSNNTLDGFSGERVDAICTKLKRKTYRFTAVRRTYIPKRQTRKLRPLGVPTGDDKLVQEVARLLLERIYEPIFHPTAHGFRPNRSCHTALKQIKDRWTATKWFIEFDIQSFFDKMDHWLLIKMLEKRISDRRFIKLISQMLGAGYCEDWKYYPTYSGTPQGGIISPILSNIYLHELDEFVNDLQQKFIKGKQRRLNGDYQRLAKQLFRIRKRIDLAGRTPQLMAEFSRIDCAMKSIPSRDPHDENYRRLRYCRYADDFVVGLIGTLAEAKSILARITKFLADQLHLQVSDEKTSIKTAKQGIVFLSYVIRTVRGDKRVKVKKHGRYFTQRSISEGIRLEVPKPVAQQFCQKYRYGHWQQTQPYHRPSLLHASDVEIVMTYNAQMRGLANYYGLAKDVKTRLNKLGYLALYSLIKTLAAKHKTKKSRWFEKLRRGKEFVLNYMVKGEEKQVRLFQLKHLNREANVGNVDAIANTLGLTASSSELIRRLSADRCEYCQRTDTLESHHIKRLKEIRAKPHLRKWQQIMMARRRKTLVLCSQCHRLLHAGKLPDSRYRDIA